MTAPTDGDGTVAELVARTAAWLGVPARPGTVDGIETGDPSAVVRGVAVTTLATSAVLERAVAIGANVVVTHEPLFYDHRGEATADLVAEHDPVHAAKAAYVAEHDLVVWRLHDAWHDRRPDGVDEGTARALGWTLDPEAAAAGTAVCDVRPTTVPALARQLAAALGSDQTRFVGDATRPVRRVGLDLGFRGFARNRSLLRAADVDAVVVGEAHEWETASYATDLARLDGTGLVVVGHVPSEQAGMSFFAEELRDVAPEVPVTFLSTPDLLTAV
ncbi:Nif3-like dinuclear metal center hexameric protein [Isoptericola aurantiacus]|uniref:Nif3-like dinuclear metal center hexameric protein n=1 Tax=Isoptericola aurantiacus TaxID=3377839 RepID=UPI00383B2410